MRKLTVARTSGIVTDIVAPMVSRRLIPPKIVTNHRISSQRHQLYSPKAINALANTAIMHGKIFSFIMDNYCAGGGGGGV